MHTAKFSEKHTLRPVNDYSKGFGKQSVPLVLKIQILEK